jgi:KRAB domain-containing zinc finger protein
VIFATKILRVRIRFYFLIHFTSLLLSHSMSGLYNLQYHVAHHVNARQFLCTECPKSYNTQSDLIQHQRIHEKQRDPYTCNECGLSFQIRSRFNTHLKTHKKDIKGPKECSICKKMFVCLSSHNRIVHMNERKYDCSMCDKKFGKKSGLDRHILTVHEKQRNFACSLCDKAFGEKAQLQKHTKTHSTFCKHCCENFNNIQEHFTMHHQDKHIKKCHSVRKKLTNEKKIDHEPEQVFIDFIDIKIETEIEQPHEDALDEDNCDLIPNIIEEESLSEVNEKYQYQCEKCSKVFRKHQHLKIHFDANHTDKIYKCKVCTKVFNYKSALDRHIKIIHEKQKNHICSDCGKSFASKFELNQHYDGYHNEDSKATRTCRFCEKVFMKQRNLCMHMQAVHSDNKFSCELCFKSFSFKSAKDRHVKIIHHNQKEHKCEQCQKFFGTRYDYRNHIEHYHSETPNEVGRYHCSECNKDFVSSSALTRHNRGIHENIKPPKLVNFRCKMCKELITNKYRLDKHMAQVHMGGKKTTRTCKFCELDFQLYDKFKSHVDGHKDLFICMTCGEAFSDQDQYSIHKDVHKRIDFNLRQFICDLCGHRLFNKIQLDVS